MPLFALVGQFTSTCRLKSWNLSSVAMFEPADVFTRQPFSTIQLEDFAGLSKLHPAKLRPLNSVSGFSHLTFGLPGKTGARSPVQVHAVPFGPFATPLKRAPASFPSKTRSFLLPSSVPGDTNCMVSAWSMTLGNERAFPQRPTKLALHAPFFGLSSSQEGSCLPSGSMM